MKAITFSLMTGLVLAASNVSAHDSWLAADQRQLAPGSELGLSMTSGEHFPVPGTSIARERIEKSNCRQGSVIFALSPVERKTKTLELKAQPPAGGGVTCWVELKPRELNLAINKVAEYLDEIDAPEAVRVAWAQSPSPKRWIETYTKSAKVVVPQPVGASGAGTPQPPVGLSLEFVAGVDLSMGRITGTLPVQVLLDGKPLAGLSVALGSERGGKPQRLRTNAAGQVTFAAPGAGRWMLSATDLRVVDVSTSKWNSHFSTLVFEVLSPSK
jgi:uncharacterized GH25 family protein